MSSNEKEEVNMEAWPGNVPALAVKEPKPSVDVEEDE